MEACNVSQMYEEDDLLIRELLHNESPIILTPRGITSFDHSNLISNTYSGPTISDIETALLATSSNFTNYTHDFSSSLDRISEMERGVSRTENKYILKIKSNGNVMADDGYKWRKYGQKTIKNSSNPRSYYKCTNPRCGAKKQVERSNDDPDTLIITYEGLHLHYMYPFFIFGDSDPPTKKFRRFNFDTPAAHDQQTTTEERKQDQASTVVTDYHPQVASTAISSQGLLEDMVPLLVRNPIIYTSKSSSSSSSSYPSPPASPSFSWSPDFDAYLDSHV